jgi:vacuolar protein sorting-associated protein 35
VAVLAPSNAELAFKLYLEIGVATDLLAYSTKQHYRSASVEFTSIAYDFLTQAFLVYEDQVSESAAQIRSITSIVGSLLCCKTFEKTDYEALITKTAQYAAKLLKKQDQCRMVCLCSRLFYLGGKDVSSSVCHAGPAALFVDNTFLPCAALPTRISTPTATPNVY